MQLHELKPAPGATKRKQILGRGQGSGRGKTCGRGEKGQKSRSKGRTIIASSEGGQMPLIRRLPKLGFRSHRPILNQVINVAVLETFDNGTVINAAFLKTQGLIGSRNKPFKILGDGKLTKSLVIQEGTVSKTAQEKIVKAGGKIETGKSVEKTGEKKAKA